jgi:hypothetical protein
MFNIYQQAAPEFVSSILPEDKQQYVEELCPYICDAFGNSIRIDYGTGHELNMILFYMCLFKLEIILTDDLNSLVLNAFSSYISTMRALQTTYILEPAGSHGVWGLDDYHCLIFVWGSAQVHTYTATSAI